jgi:hypothetical protein
VNFIPPQFIPAILCLLALAGCTALPEPSATPTPFPSGAPTIFPTPTPSLTPSPPPSHTPIPTATDTASPAPSPTIPFIATACPTVTPTPTATNTPLISPTPSRTPTRTPTATLTNTPLPSNTPSITATATLVPTPTKVRTPTITPTPTASRTPTPTITWTPHPCPSRTPTLTPSPTHSLTPTPTPALPALAEVVVGDELLESLLPSFWQFPPENFTRHLQQNTSQCAVECLGLRWTSRDFKSVFTLLLYRTPDFPDAYTSALAAQSFYVPRGYVEQAVPPGGSLPSHTWLAVKDDRDFVLITSQGPAVISLFWQGEGSIPTASVFQFLVAVSGEQVGILIDNDYRTGDLRLTPLP